MKKIFKKFKRLMGRVTIQAQIIGAITLIIAAAIPILYHHYTKNKPLAEVHFIDVLVNNDLPFPTLDFKLINMGNEPAVVKKIKFEIINKATQKVNNIYENPTAKYNIILNESHELFTHQKINPKDTDRFLITIAEKRNVTDTIDTINTYKLSICLYYNKSDFIRTSAFTIYIQPKKIEGNPEEIIHKINYKPITVSSRWKSIIK